MRALEDCQIDVVEGRFTKDQLAAARRLLAPYTNWVPQVRGGAMAGAFYVERNLDVAIECYFLGAEAGVTSRAKVFADTILNTLTFERSIQVALVIAE